MKNFFLNLTVTAAVAIAIFLIGFSAAQINNAPVTQAPSGPTTAVALMINNGEYVKSYTGLPVPESPTVLALLEYASERQGFSLDVDKSSSLGAFVKQIDEQVNGQNQLYWQYYVNGSQPLVAADRFILQGGETVLWTFSKSER